MKHSIDEYFEVEIQIVDHCNLNCDNCNHFSNIAEPWFMSKEEFCYTIDKINTELVPHGLQRIMIIGGEPLLHPELLNFVEYIQSTISNDVKVDIITNGIILNTWSLEQIDYLKTKANLLITPYISPSEDKTLVREEILDQNKTLAARMLFMPNLVDKNGTGDFSNCQKQRIPCFFIKNYRLYMCPFGGTIDIYNKKFNCNIKLSEYDYLDLKELTFNSLKQFLDSWKGDICKYCKSTNHILGWTRNGYNYYENIDILELFQNNFSKFDEIINVSNLSKRLINTKFKDKNLFSAVDNKYSVYKYNSIKNRYNGKIDIIIPYYHITEEQVDQLYNTLSSQTIINECCIYLISDDSPNDDLILKKFYNNGLNVFFYRLAENSGPGVARQLGIDNSYNPYFFCLDSDDNFIVSNALELLYNARENCDLVSGGTNIDNGSSVDYECWHPSNRSGSTTHCILYNRDYINKHNFRFKDYYIHEDYDWIQNIMRMNPIVNQVKDVCYSYNKHNPTNIGALTTSTDKILCKIILLFNSCNLFTTQDIWNSLLLLSKTNMNNKNDDALKRGFVLYFGYIFYNSLSLEERQSLKVDSMDSYILDMQRRIKEYELYAYIDNRWYGTKRDYGMLLNKYIENSAIKKHLKKYLISYTN